MKKRIVNKPTVEKFCEVMDMWAAIRSEQDEHFAECWRYIRLQIEKSCLLDRMLYGGEPLRTEPCPVHKGKWSGCVFREEDSCACVTNGNVTGWLPVVSESSVVKPNLT